MIAEETSRSLAAARDKLAAWQTRLDALDIALRRLSGRESRQVAALREEVRDQFQRLSSDVMRLEAIERTWRSIRVDVKRDARELERTYQKLEQSLAHTVDY